MKLLNAQNLLSYFEGHWSLERNVSVWGDIFGQATFEFLDHQSGTVLNYAEQVDLSLHKSKTSKGYRKYIYKYESQFVNVYFDDGPDKGNLFHQLIFHSNNGAHGSHVCKNDFYESLYEFETEKLFHIKHSIRGPKKDYIITTRYQKIA